MLKRIVVSVILLPLLLLVLLWAPKICTALLFAALAGIAAWELLAGTGLVKEIRPVIYTVIIAALVPVWSYFGCNGALGEAGALVFFVLLFMEMMISQMKVKFEKLALCIVAGLLIPYLLSSLTRILSPDGGRYAVLIPFIVAFLSDSGAYFIGCRFGKHKLAPTISPNKSVEGVAGGIAFGVIGMLLYTGIMQLIFKCQVNYGYALVYGVLGSLAGVFGDLCFSVIKRQTGIKDYGNIIPGHGGVLDRFDSMLTVGPLIEILLITLPVVVK